MRIRCPECGSWVERQVGTARVAYVGEVRYCILSCPRCDLKWTLPQFCSRYGAFRLLEYAVPWPPPPNVLLLQQEGELVLVRYPDGRTTAVFLCPRFAQPVSV